jgi:hypothetical protein
MPDKITPEMVAQLTGTAHLYTPDDATQESSGFVMPPKPAVLQPLAPIAAPAKPSEYTLTPADVSEVMGRKRQEWANEAHQAALARQEADRAEKAKAAKRYGGWAGQAVVRGLENTAASLGGLTALGGELVNSEPLKNAGMALNRSMNEKASEIPGVEFSDISGPRSAARWTLEKTLENAPFLIGSFGGAAVGANLASKVIPKVAGEWLEQSAVKKVGAKAGEELVAAQAHNIARTIGARAGVVGTTAAIESGGDYADLVERNLGSDKAALSTLATGIGKGFVETMGGPQRYIDKWLGTETGGVFRKAVDGLNNAFRFGKAPDPANYGVIHRVLGEALRIGREEGMEEVIQEGMALANIGFNDPSFKMFTAENLPRILEAGAGGFAVGALLGGIGGGVMGRERYARERGWKPEPEDTSTPPDTTSPAPTGEVTGEVTGAVKGLSEGAHAALLSGTLLQANADLLAELVPVSKDKPDNERFQSAALQYSLNTPDASPDLLKNYVKAIQATYPTSGSGPDLLEDGSPFLTTAQKMAETVTAKQQALDGQIAVLEGVKPGKVWKETLAAYNAAYPDAPVTNMGNRKQTLDGLKAQQKAWREWTPEMYFKESAPVATQETPSGETQTALPLTGGAQAATEASIAPVQAVSPAPVPTIPTAPPVENQAVSVTPEPASAIPVQAATPVTVSAENIVLESGQNPDASTIPEGVTNETQEGMRQTKAPEGQVVLTAKKEASLRKRIDTIFQKANTPDQALAHIEKQFPNPDGDPLHQFARAVASEKMASEPTVSGQRKVQGQQAFILKYPDGTLRLRSTKKNKDGKYSIDRPYSPEEHNAFLKRGEASRKALDARADGELIDKTSLDAYPVMAALIGEGHDPKFAGELKSAFEGKRVGKNAVSSLPAYHEDVTYDLHRKREELNDLMRDRYGMGENHFQTEREVLDELAREVSDHANGVKTFPPEMDRYSPEYGKEKPQYSAEELQDREEDWQNGLREEGFTDDDIAAVRAGTTDEESVRASIREVQRLAQEEADTEISRMAEAEGIDPEDFFAAPDEPFLESALREMHATGYDLGNLAPEEAASFVPEARKAPLAEAWREYRESPSPETEAAFMGEWDAARAELDARAGKAPVPKSAQNADRTIAITDLTDSSTGQTIPAGTPHYVLNDGRIPYRELVNTGAQEGLFAPGEVKAAPVEKQAKAAPTPKESAPAEDKQTSMLDELTGQENMFAEQSAPKPSLSIGAARDLLALPYEDQAFPMGSKHHTLRRQVLEELTGTKVSMGQAGANAVREALYDAANAKGQSIAERDDEVRAWLKKIAESEGTDENLPESFTSAEVINRDYRTLKEKLGERGAQKYFTQVDRLLDPNEHNVVEYRANGVVTKEGDKYLFHSIGDIELKEWRLSGKPVNVTGQFKKGGPKYSLASNEDSQYISPESKNKGEKNGRLGNLSVASYASAEETLGAVYRPTDEAIRIAVASIASDLGVGADDIQVVETPGSEDGKLAAKIGHIFRYEPVFLSVKKETQKKWNGVFWNDIIFINSDAKEPHITTVAHELAHSLEQNHPDLYEQLYDTLHEDIDAFNSFLRDFAKLYPDASLEEKSHEFVAFTVEQRMFQRGFWHKLYMRVPEVVRNILNQISRLLGILKQDKRYETLHYFKDIQRIKDAIDVAMTEYARREAEGGSLGSPFTPSLKQKYFSRALSAADMETYYDAHEPEYMKNIGQTFASFFSGRNEGWAADIKPDVKRWQKILSLPMHYTKAVAGLHRAWNAMLALPDYKHEYENEMFRSPDGQHKFLEEIDHYLRKNKEEAKRWKQYIFSRDLHRIGWKVVKTGKEGESAIFEIRNPQGVVVNSIAVTETASPEEQEKQRKKNFGLTDAEYAAQEKAWKDAYAREADMTGFSPDGKNALIAYRTVADLELAFQMRGIRAAIAQFAAKGRPLPNVPVWRDGTKVEISLAAAINEMGQLRGFYMPRLRQQGQYKLYATKEGENPRLEFFDTKTMLNVRYNELTAQGFTVEKNVSGTLSNEVFSRVQSTAAIQDIVQSTIDRMTDKTPTEALGVKGWNADWQEQPGTQKQTLYITGEFNEAQKQILKSYRKKPDITTNEDGTETWKFEDSTPGTLQQITKDLLQYRNIISDASLEFARVLVDDLAETLRNRSSLARRTGRTDVKGKDVVLGYEADPLVALTMAGKGIAASAAKHDVALSMYRCKLGTDEMAWDDWQEKAKQEGKKADWAEYRDYVNARKIDAAKQPEANKEWQELFDELMRGTDKLDSLMGSARGVASLMYLWGRPAAALVNLTTMGTSTPAAIAGYSGVSLGRAFHLVAQQAKNYLAVRKGMASPEIQMLFWEIGNRGWAEAQFNKEAVSVLKSKLGRAYDTLIDTGMYLFAKAENVNRIGSIAAAYFALKEQAQKNGEKFNDLDLDFRPEGKQGALLMQAKAISDSANGVYTQANLPSWARGSGVFANAARSFYVFRTYTHTYLVTMLDLLGKGGYAGKEAWSGENANAKMAALWMATAGAIFAGAGSSILYSAVMAALGLVRDDDPEERLYAWILDHFGAFGEQVARYGLAGAAGVNIKGSLQISIGDMPSNIFELLGAPGSIVTNAAEGLNTIRQGDFLKGMEKLAPYAVAGPLKAYRESTEGFTSKSNAPLFYGDEQVRLTPLETALRSLSFQPARPSGIREKQWNETKQEQRFSNQRTEIYRRIRDFWNQPPEERTKEKWMEILVRIQEYNETVSALPRRDIPRITRESLIAARKSTLRPPKKERLRAVEMEEEADESEE